MNARLAKMLLFAASSAAVAMVPTFASAQYAEPAPYIAPAPGQPMSVDQAEYNLRSAGDAAQQAQADLAAARRHADEVSRALGQEQQNLASLQSRTGEAQSALPQLADAARRADQRVSELASAADDAHRRLDAAQADVDRLHAAALADIDARPEAAGAVASVQAAQHDVDAAVNDAITQLSYTAEYRIAYNDAQAADQNLATVKSRQGAYSREIDDAVRRSTDAHNRLNALVSQAVDNNVRVVQTRRVLQLNQDALQRVRADLGQHLTDRADYTAAVSCRDSARYTADQAQDALRAAQADATNAHYAFDQANSGVTQDSPAIQASQDRINRITADLRSASEDVSARQARVDQTSAALQYAQQTRDQAVACAYQPAPVYAPPPIYCAPPVAPEDQWTLDLSFGLFGRPRRDFDGYRDFHREAPRRHEDFHGREDFHEHEEFHGREEFHRHEDFQEHERGHRR